MPTLEKRRSGVAAIALLILAASGAAVTSCSARKPEGQTAAPAAPLGAGSHKGRVTATMDSGGYTYIEFEEGGKKLWAAASVFKVKVGDAVELAGGLPMKDFASKTLGRTFEEILFVNSVKVEGRTEAPAVAPGLPIGHVPISDTAPAAPVTVAPGSIPKAADGWTVQECFARKAELKGKTIRVRGRVVKFSPEIMGSNWLHLRDGSGAAGTDDLTITTKDTARPGDLVLVTGTLVLDKDLGSGYFFPVLVENATVKIEARSGN